MIYTVKGDQISYGEVIGILLIENYVPFIPGDVANATTYSYPVRFQRIDGVTHRHLFDHDRSVKEKVFEASKKLVKEGVKAITGDCGFLALFQEELKEEMNVPVFLSSLIQLHFIKEIIPAGSNIGIITASSASLTADIFGAAGINFTDRLIIKGLENKKHFKESVIDEAGFLDTEKLEKEVVETTRELNEETQNMSAILLECSLLPPYGKAVSEVVNVPVFDYITMIDYVYSAVIKRNFKGYM